MPREPKLDMLPDKDMKLSGTHFRKVVRRIESIVPSNGNQIKTEQIDGGIKINFAGEIISLNVCQDGLPATLLVYTPSTTPE